MKKLYAFLSSAMTGELNEERIAVRILFQNSSALTEFYELYSIDEHASPQSIQKAFINEVCESHILILLLNSELRPAVLKEYEAAKSNNLKIFAYVKKNSPNRTTELNDFINTEFYPNIHCGDFYDSLDLTKKIADDLKDDLIKSYSRKYKSKEELQILTLPNPDSQYRYYPIDDIIRISNSGNIANTDIDQLHSLATLLLHEGAFRDALLIFEVILYRDDTDWQAYHNRGLILQEMGLFSNALFSLKKALQFNPDSDATLYNIGNIYYDLSRFPDAIFYYEKSLSISPKKIVAIQRLINCYINIGQFPDALKWAKHAVQVQPDEFNYANLSIVLNVTGDFSEALSNAENIKQDKYLYHDIKSLILFKKQDWQAALSEIIQSETFKNLSYDLAIRKINCLLKLEQVDDGINLLDKIENSFPITANDFNNIGYNLYSNFSLVEKAEELYRKAINADPALMTAWNNLQFLYGTEKMLELGLSACEDALAINHNDPISKRNKFNFLLLLGRIGELPEFIINNFTKAFGIDSLDIDKEQMNTEYLSNIRKQPGFENIKDMQELEQLMTFLLKQQDEGK